MTSRGATMSKWTPTEATNYFGDDNLFYEIRGHVDGYGDDETIALVDATPLDDEWRWKNAVLLASAPELVEALEYSAEIIKIARGYFPKSIRHRDAFALENTNAAINKALAKARGE